MSRNEPILTVDVSQALDLMLTRALDATDFSLERCGSEVAVLHKLRAGNAFLVVFENRPQRKAEPIHDILDLAREVGVPMMLVCDKPLPPERERPLSYLLRVCAPPLYPYQLLREVKSFQWREETVYVVRNPGRRAQEFVVVLVAGSPLASGETERLRDYFVKRGNKFLYFDRVEKAIPWIAERDKALVLFAQPGEGEVGLQEFLALQKAVQTGGVVPLLAVPACTPRVAMPLLHAGAPTILPWPAPEDDLRELYDSLRFMRGPRA